MGLKTKMRKTWGRKFSKFYALKGEFVAINPIFDTRYLDKKIGDYALSIVPRPASDTAINKNNVAFLASTLGRTGGHTELLKNFAQALPKKYKSNLFLTKKTDTEKNASLKVAEIKKYSKISGVDFDWMNEKGLLKKLMKKLMKFSPSVLITFIHMDDSFAVGLLALLNKYTKIKIIFCNIGSQHSSLGMSFAHLIWEGMPATAYLTQKYRGFKNTKVLGLCYLTKDNLPTFSEQEIATVRRNMGIPENAICTMTGCLAYKLFENDTSPYLEMIKKLLEKNENLWHVLITRFDKKQKEIFDKKNMPKRFILMDFKDNFKLYFKCADVFIDSIPHSSALTMVDLMSLRVPIVAFKNTDNLAFTFHEYLPKNYDYLFENISDMQAGIEKLYQSKDEQERIKNINFEHFLEKFEGHNVVENVLNANTFDLEIDDKQYENFKEIKLKSWPL